VDIKTVVEKVDLSAENERVKVIYLLDQVPEICMMAAVNCCVANLHKFTMKTV